MLTTEEIQDAEKQSKKSEVVKKLLDFYNEAQRDGKLAMRIALNKKWLDLSVIIDKTDIDIKGDDKVYDSFLKTTKLFEDIEKNSLTKKGAGKGKLNGSFLDNHADTDREK